MDNKIYIIQAEWGDYEEYIQVPLFACNLKPEAEFAVNALRNRENPYWERVVKLFHNEQFIPLEITFNFLELDIVSIDKSNI